MSDRHTRPMRHATRFLILVSVLIAAFALINLIGLDRFPLAYEDEPWIAEPGYRFWQRGQFMSELIGGLFGTERHYMLHAPLYSIISGAVVWIFGFGLLPVRLLSLGLAVTTAALTYRLGSRLLSPFHGLVAVGILTFWRLVPAQPARPSGMPFVDLGRLARYDIVVPFFALLGYLLILPWLLAKADTTDGTDAASTTPTTGVVNMARAKRWQWRLRFLLAGACGGLALDSHPMGLIVIATLGVLCLVTARTRARPRAETLAAIGWIAAGTLLTLLPYLWFMYIARAELVAQQQYVAERYDLLNLKSLATSLLAEWHRYGSIGRGLLAGQPAALLFVLCGGAGLYALLFGALRRDPRAALIRAGLLTGVAMFAIGVHSKFYFYLAVIWPWMALTAAIGLVAAFESRARVVRYGAIALAILTAGDSVAASVTLAQRARQTTSYLALCERLAMQLPPQAKVVARPNYWLGLMPRVRAYQSVMVPIFFISSRFYDPHGPQMSGLLQRIDPDAIILDWAMLQYLHDADNPEKAQLTFVRGSRGLRDYLATHTARKTVFRDRDYGTFEIYILRR